MLSTNICLNNATSHLNSRVATYTPASPRVCVRPMIEKTQLDAQIASPIDLHGVTNTLPLDRRRRGQRLAKPPDFPATLR